MLLVGAIGLAAVAMLFGLWPWLRRGSVVASVDHVEVVKDVYRQRREEIQSELDDSLRAELDRDMSAVLLSEVGGRVGSEPAQGTLGAAAKAAVVAAILLPLLGVLLYWSVADPGALQVQGAEQVLQLDAVQDQAALEQWSERLARRVESAPDDSRSWYLFGHALLKLARYAGAAEAFSAASRLAGDDITVDVYWLQARFLAARGQLDQTSRSLAEDILRRDPGVTPVLEILAMSAVQQGDAASAVTLLNRAQSGSRDLRQQLALAQAIEQVRTQLSDPPPGIAVSVSAADEVPPHAVVFVLARPQGGGMPFAVVRRPALALPFSAVLDDLVSMSAERRLSDAEAVEVVVRLSPSGNAMPQPDDWQWVSETISLQAREAIELQVQLSAP